MKTIIIEILFMVLFTAASVAQTNSVIKTKDARCEFYTTYKIKERGTELFKSKMLSVKVENIKSIVFLNDDSLIMKKGSIVSWGLTINNIKEIGVKNGNYQFLGLGLGIIIGGLAGYIVSESGALKVIGGFDFTPAWVTTLSTFIGAGVGSIVGVLIGANMNSYEYLDLLQIPEKDKKAKLIKFLREK